MKFESHGLKVCVEGGSFEIMVGEGSVKIESLQSLMELKEVIRMFFELQRQSGSQKMYETQMKAAEDLNEMKDDIKKDLNRGDEWKL